MNVTLDTRVPDVIVRVMLTANRAIDDFLSDCRARGWSERSISSYAATLYRFADRLPVDLDVSKIEDDDLRRYRAARQRQVSRNTLAGEEAHIASWFGWMFRTRKIAANPMDRIERTKRTPSADLDVKTVSTDDVRRMMEAAQTWSERLALGILVYLGPRRRAVARLRLADWDRGRGRIRFYEKGNKVVWKTIPVELEQLLNAADAAGAFNGSDYLVPPEGYLQRTKGDRDDRVIWRLVRRVADRAGVDAHVHALRAAFACFYLETATESTALVDLQEILGHASLETTRVYLRRLSRERAMDSVRNLSWGVAISGDAVAARRPQFAAERFESSAVMGAGGFEPPSGDSQAEHGGSSQHRALELAERRNAALEQAIYEAVDR